MEDKTTYQFIATFTEDSLLHPPTLLKLSLTTSISSSRAPSASQSFSQSFSQPSRPDTSKLVCSGTRLMNGQQQSVEVILDKDDVLEAAKKGSKNKNLAAEEAITMLFEAFEKPETCKAEYDSHSKTLDISFDGLPGLEISLAFDKGNKEHITPAFAVAFEAARAFNKQNEDNTKSLQTSAKNLRLKEQDLRSTERKVSNLQIELTEANTKLRRLLDSGGSSLADIGSKGGASQRREMRMGEVGNGGREESESPRKKRKAAMPTLGKAGRTSVKQVAAGFVDSESSDEGSDSQKGVKVQKTGNNNDKDQDAGQHARQSSRSTSREVSMDDETVKAGKGKGAATKKVVADPNPPKLGRTGNKPVATGFVDDDDEDSQSKATSATEESDDDVTGKKKKVGSTRSRAKAWG